MFAGVASGLADEFGLDPAIVRVALVVLALVGGMGLSLYLLAWFLLPDDQGNLAVRRACTDHEPGAIVLGVFTAISVFSRLGDERGWWPTLVTLVVGGGLVFFVVRHVHRKYGWPDAVKPGGREEAAAAGGGQGAAPGPGDPSAGTWPDPRGERSHDPQAPRHGSPTRGGHTSVFDPVTGRWVPAMPEPGRLAPPPNSPGQGFAGQTQPGHYGVPADPAPAWRGQNWSDPRDVPPATATTAVPAPVAPPTPPRRFGFWATVVSLAAALAVGVGAGQLVLLSSSTADAAVVGASAALALLSLIIVIVGLRGLRARVLTMAVVVLLPFAAAVAHVDATGQGSGFSIQVGPR